MQRALEINPQSIARLAEISRPTLMLLPPSRVRNFRISRRRRSWLKSCWIAKLLPKLHKSAHKKTSQNGYTCVFLEASVVPLPNSILCDTVMFDVLHICESGFKIEMHKLPNASNASCAFRISAIVSTVHPDTSLSEHKSKQRILKSFENTLWISSDEATFRKDTTRRGCCTSKLPK